MTWEISRRCKDRMFLLSPDKRLIDALLYCVAFTAKKHGIELHALVLMLNHYHLVATDTRGVRPLFMEDLNGLMARCVKHFHKQDSKPMHGPVWAPEHSYAKLWLESDEALFKSLAYVMSNPVAAAAVAYTKDWPSFVSKPEDMLQSDMVFTRPECLSKHLPATARLRFSVPSVFANSPKAFVRDVRHALDERCGTLREEIRKRRQSFWSKSRFRNLDPFSKPNTPATPNRLNPAFRGVTAEAIARAKQRLVNWLHSHRRAFELFSSGQHNAEFPAGTWWFARFAGARVAPVSSSPLLN
jgi:REP element-mobilizing transposase RayT